MSRDETAYFTGVHAIKQTDLGLLCIIDGDEVWIPISQITSDSEVTENGDEGTLAVKEWIAIEKGLV